MDSRVTLIIGIEGIDLEYLHSIIKDESAGALVGFEGTVRNQHEGRRVRSLTYEAYEPMAREQLMAACEEALRRWRLCRIAVHHRIGHLALGDCAVMILVSAPHRRDAFEACSFLIEAIKKDVPIWKFEETEEGSSWIHEGT